MAWIVAAVAAMVAGSRIWRLFRQAAEQEQLVGVITEVDQALGTITVSWSQVERPTQWMSATARHGVATFRDGLVPMTPGDYLVFAHT